MGLASVLVGHHHLLLNISSLTCVFKYNSAAGLIQQRVSEIQFRFHRDFFLFVCLNHLARQRGWMHQSKYMEFMEI